MFSYKGSHQLSPQDLPSLFHFDSSYTIGTKKKNSDYSQNEKKLVLIVDDSLKTTTPLNIIFKNLGWETQISFDGSSAVRDIVSTSPDLVILDWFMPDYNGGVALEKAQSAIVFEQIDWKTNAANKQIPVVTFSAFPKEELNVPTFPSFNIMEHWKKPMSIRDLTINSLRLIKQF